VRSFLTEHDRFFAVQLFPDRDHLSSKGNGFFLFFFFPFLQPPIMTARVHEIPLLALHDAKPFGDGCSCTAGAPGVFPHPSVMNLKKDFLYERNFLNRG